jgi:hypothetical protein
VPTRVKVHRGSLERRDEFAPSEVERSATLSDTPLRIFKLGLPDHDQSLCAQIDQNFRKQIVAKKFEYRRWNSLKKRAGAVVVTAQGCADRVEEDRLRYVPEVARSATLRYVPGCFNDRVATLGEEAIAYNRMTNYLRAARIIPRDATSLSAAISPHIDESDEAILGARDEPPFSSVRQFFWAIHLPVTRVYRRLSAKLGLAPLQKHGTGRMMGFKLSKYIHGPRYGDALDRGPWHSEINGRFSVSFGRFSIFESTEREWRKLPNGHSNSRRDLDT